MIKKILAFFIILTVLAGIALFFYVYKFYESVKFNADKIIYYNPPQSALFYDRNGNLLDIRYSKQDRLYVKYKNIPPRVIETLLATEDTAFFEENMGININAIIRALITDIKAGKKVEGASTITQQLVKNIYLNRKKTIKRKLTEIMIAMKVENILTKEQILERYLNQIFFGNHYYGIKTAALGYFHKNLNDLSLKEIAMLIALPKGPSLYNPIRHYEFNLKRADLILKRMYILGWISPEEYKNAIMQRPKVYKQMITPKAPYAVDEAIRRLLINYPDLLTKGYKITLTIDLPTQKIAKEALKWNYKRILKLNPKLNPNQLNGALININPKNGEVLAIVGGVDYQKSKFNRVTQSKRSMGSSIKPFVYQIALNSGYNPGTLIPDMNRKFKLDTNGKDNNETKYWMPKNFEDNTLGLITLRYALIHSRNLATINLAMQIGLDKVIKNLYRFGFDKMPRNLSIVIGSVGESPWKVSELYTIFSNYGKESKVHLIKEISIPKENFKIEISPKLKNIEPPYQAYLITSILQDVVRKGTGRKAYVRGIQIAGKTGTTNKDKDAWFCGFTPDSETIIWFGNDNSTSLGKWMTGGRVSAPAFSYFYKKLLKIHPELKRYFYIPKEVKTYLLPNGHKELFTPLSPPPKQKALNEVPIF